MTTRISAVVAAACLSLVLSACGNETKSSFMDGCKSSGASNAVCSCTYGKLEGDFGLIQKNPNFAFSTAFQNHQADAMQSCRGAS